MSDLVIYDLLNGAIKCLLLSIKTSSFILHPYSKIYPCKTKIIPVHAGENNLAKANLFAIPGHKIVSLIQVFEGGVAGYFSVGVY